MTTKEVSDRILARVDDDATSPASVATDPNTPVPPEVLSAIAEGQELASLLTLCLETTVSFTLTAAAPFYLLRSLLPDYLVPLRLMGPSGRIRPSSVAELDARDPGWQASVGTTDRYLTLGFSFFAVTPQPVEDTTVQFTYAHAPAPAVAEVFLELPEAFHGAIVDYGIYRIKLKEGGQGLERGMRHLNRFLDEMTRLGDYTRAKSRAARYDTEPFELALFDRAKLISQITQQLQKKANVHA